MKYIHERIQYIIDITIHLNSCIRHIECTRQRPPRFFGQPDAPGSNPVALYLLGRQGALITLIPNGSLIICLF